MLSSPVGACGALFRQSRGIDLPTGTEGAGQLITAP